jgi:hypothetical protein
MLIRISEQKSELRISQFLIDLIHIDLNSSFPNFRFEDKKNDRRGNKGSYSIKLENTIPII